MLIWYFYCNKIILRFNCNSHGESSSEGHPLGRFNRALLPELLQTWTPALHLHRRNCLPHRYGFLLPQQCHLHALRNPHQLHQQQTEDHPRHRHHLPTGLGIVRCHRGRMEQYDLVLLRGSIPLLRNLPLGLPNRQRLYPPLFLHPHDPRGRGLLPPLSGNISRQSQFGHPGQHSGSGRGMGTDLGSVRAGSADDLQIRHEQKIPEHFLLHRGNSADHHPNPQPQLQRQN